MDYVLSTKPIQKHLITYFRALALLKKCTATTVITRKQKLCQSLFCVIVMEVLGLHLELGHRKQILSEPIVLYFMTSKV